MAKKNSKNNNTETETQTQDDAIYEAAAKFVNARVENSKKSLLEIGEYLLEHFFGGDIAAVKSKRPGKGPSIRQLAERDDINMSRTDLSRAVNLAAQEKEIGAVPTSGQLTLSHKEILLRVQDLETKKEYMEIAVKEKLSVRQLEERLKKDGVAVTAGTDPAKVVSLEHRRLEKAFDFLTNFSPKTLREMDAVTAQSTLDKAEVAQQGLAKVIEALKKRAGVAMKKVA